VAESFSVGEIAIAWYPGEARHGVECEIIALPQPHDHPSPITGKWMKAHKYMVLYEGTYYQVFEKRLRKRRPPPTREPVSSWDDVIVWRPKETSHV
jgi:hypothetical protein